MTPFDALAAAIRERLTSGRPAPLPGLGTLVRQHVSARVEERADGTRVLLPPGETIGLAPTDATHETLAPTFGRFLALPDRDVPRAYAEAADQLEARLAATGEVRLPGVGLLRRTSGGVILGVEADLLAAVNRAYEGLSPVGPSRTGDLAPSAGASPPAAEHAVVEPPAAQPPVSEPPVEEPTPSPDVPDAGPAGADPFMIGLPPVDSAEAPDVTAAPADPETTAEEAQFGGVDAPQESGDPSAPTNDDAFDLPVPADASDFAFAPTVADTSDFVDGPIAPSSHASPDLPASPGADAPGDADAFAAPPDVDDDPIPEPFDPGDLSTEPLLASDLVPAAVEPPEPDEPSVSSPGAEPAAPPPGDVREGRFVDDDTLDADLDDVLSVPFGRPGEDPIAEVLPPTSPDTEADAEPESEEPPSQDDWIAETWTAAESAPPPVGLGTDDVIEIEDAEVIEDADVTASIAADDVDDVEASHPTMTPPPSDPTGVAEAPLDPPPPAPDEATPPHGPDEEFEALLASPPGEPPPVIVSDDLPRAPVAEPSAEAPRRSPWGWVIGLVVLAAAIAAAVWLWPRLSGPQAEPDVVAEAPEPLATAPVLDPQAPAEDASEDSLVAPPAEALAPAGPAPAPAPPPAASAEAPPPAASGGARAFAAPRLDGLDDGDRRALTGPPIDPSMGGWTLVVASLRSEEAAADLMGRYRAAGYRTAVFPPSGRTVTRYRIGVGQFGSRDQARRLLDRVFEYEPGGTWPLNLRTL